MTFVDRLLELRTAKEIPLTNLAVSVGISPRSMKYYSVGEREPSMTTLMRLADYFNVSLDYLVGRSDVPERR